MPPSEDFSIKVDVNGRSFVISVKCLYASAMIARYQLTAGGKTCILRTNRPEVVRGRRIAIRWKIEKGSFDDALGFSRTLDCLEAALRSYEDISGIRIDPKDLNYKPE